MSVLDTTNIAILTTGGTIMKQYDRATGIVKNDPWDASRIFTFLTSKANIVSYCTIKNVFSKDSNDITPDDVNKLINAIMESKSANVLILIGTDRMTDIAKDIGNIDGKTIVFVGAMVPMCMSHTDAEFNLGFALGCIKLLQPGTYIAMNGEVFTHTSVRKNYSELKFEEIAEQ